MNVYTTDLQPGDAILYYSHDLFNLVTALKTWCKVSHIEVYAGNGKSWASRNGIGVNLYDFRYDSIVHVMRPDHFNVQDASVWFEKVRGEGYDWKGLLCFTLAVSQGSQDKMFCSEFATRLYRVAGLNLFNPNWDADEVPPSFFLVSPCFKKICLLPQKS